MRGRGLKLTVDAAIEVFAGPSPSVRGRGLKPGGLVCLGRSPVVALRAGAWIETCRALAIADGFFVALRAGAWIETRYSTSCRRQVSGSPSVRGRGLKRIPTLGTAMRDGRSPSVRGRGLKRGGEMSTDSGVCSSPSVRGRGLKPSTGASGGEGSAGRPPCGGVD